MEQLKQSFCLPCFAEIKDNHDIKKVIEAAAKTGYQAVEIWHRDNVPFEFICETAHNNEMAVASMCGHNGITEGLNDPSNHARIQEELVQSITVAKRNSIPNIIIFSGVRNGRNDTECIDIIAEGLGPVIGSAEKAGITLTLELLNSKIDHPGYQGDHTAWGVKVVQKIDSSKVTLLYDIYHMQIMEGDLCRTIKENIDHIGHFHTAGNPGRYDLDNSQEINYRAVADTIASCGYSGYVAHEFRPKGDKIEALKKAYSVFRRKGI